MFAFLTKFKTEVRAFITDAATSLHNLESKVEAEFAELKAKVESLGSHAAVVVKADEAKVEATIEPSTSSAPAEAPKTE